MGDRTNRGPQNGGLIRMGIRTLAGGIGLASESMKAHKEQKAAKTEGQGRRSTSRTNCEVGESKAVMTEVLEVASASPTNIEGGGDTDRDVDAFEVAPPSYSSSSDRKAGQDQYPDKNAVDIQYRNEDVGGESEENLEEEWNLDDAQDEVIGKSAEEGPVRDTSELQDTFLRNHPPPKNVEHAPTGKLPLPVVLPQRRPKDRSRGFIRAYAPLLDNCGIDQATWLAFLDTFQKSSAANPWLNAINLASIGTMFMPHIISIVAGFAIQQATNAAIELQARGR